MGLDLPYFNYHLNPLETGSMEASSNSCICCNIKQGHIYTGPVEGDEDLLDKLCPWCIQNGQANKKFQAIFTPPEAIGNFSSPVKLSQGIIQEISQRTPGFFGWQESKWWIHCDDGGIFLGIVGLNEIEQLGKKVIKSLREYFPQKSPTEFLAFLGDLKKDNSPSAYLFQCRKCSEYGIYADEEEQAPD